MLIKKKYSPIQQNIYNRFESVNEDFKLIRLLTTTRDVIYKSRQKELNKNNIHVRRVAVLYTIDSLGDNAIPSLIAKKLIRKRHTISELLAKMETDGLIIKRNSIPNKKICKVMLTKYGRQILDQVSSRKSINSIIQVLSKTEKENLNHFLYILQCQALEYLGMKYESPLLSLNNDNYNLYMMLVDTADTMHRARQRELAPLGINREQSSIITSIKVLGEHATPSIIANRLFRKRNTISQLLINMEREGVIQKSHDLPNRKKVHVTLTEKGIALYNKIYNQQYSHIIMNSLSSKDRTSLEKYLYKLLNKGLNELVKYTITDIAI